LEQVEEKKHVKREDEIEEKKNDEKT